MARRAWLILMPVEQADGWRSGCARREVRLARGDGGDLETGPSRERAGGDLAAGPGPDLGVASRHVQGEEAREPGTDKLTSAQPGCALKGSYPA
jgi:hypothetical protein